MLSMVRGDSLLEIGIDLPKIVQRAVGRRAHLRTSSGSAVQADHT